MNINVIIPMAGIGKRFLDNNYTSHKSLLKTNNNLTILENIFKNFNIKQTNFYLILSNKDLAKKIKLYFPKYNFKLIIIKKHNKGPLNSILSAQKTLKKFLYNKSKIFVCYSDIIWNWSFKKVLKFTENKNIIVFTHKGFHPHIEVNPNADFCLSKKKLITNVKKKGFIGSNYKTNLLAIGCYYFNNFSLLNNTLLNIKIRSQTNEFYLIDLLEKNLKEKKIIYYYSVKKFAHLGIPSQYEDFLSWQKYFVNNQKTKLISNNFLLKENPVVVLAGGKGLRTSSIVDNKILMKLKNKYFYEIIFDSFKSKSNHIILNNINLKKEIIYKNLNFIKIPKTNSMLDTIENSKEYLLKLKNFFLTSCDCVGKFDALDLRKLITENTPDIVFFGFKFSNLQKNLSNSHSLINTSNKLVTDIKVKHKYSNLYLGHAGYFWIKNGKIFDYLQKFKNSNYYKSLNRESLIDDYFKYLIKGKMVRASYIVLEQYIHIGSSTEYQEYIYWQNYFTNKN